MVSPLIAMAETILLVVCPGIFSAESACPASWLF
jgi:hypothetical protein